MADYKLVVSWDLVGDDQRQCSFGFTADPSADEGVVETKFDDCWNIIGTGYKPATILSGYTWYEGRAADGKWGPTFRESQRNNPGDAAGINHWQLPPQCAVVVSLRIAETGQRRHWGRVYLPAPSTYYVAEPSGRNHSPGAFADAFKSFFDACKVAGWTPVVHARYLGINAAMPIGSIAVDDVFDTQRRRAYEDPASTQVRTLA